jgi:hypothetical protein
MTQKVRVHVKPSLPSGEKEEGARDGYKDITNSVFFQAFFIAGSNNFLMSPVVQK